MCETSAGDAWQPLIGCPVVLDTKGPYIYLGTLKAVGQEAVVLTSADVHYRGDSPTTSELYLLQARKDGVRVSREQVFVMRGEVVSLSRLSDIVEY